MSNYLCNLIDLKKQQYLSKYEHTYTLGTQNTPTAKFIATEIVYLFCTLYRGGSVRASLPSPCFSTMQRRHRSDLRSQEHHGLPRQMSHANIKSILDYQVEFTNFEINHISYNFSEISILLSKKSHFRKIQKLL